MEENKFIKFIVIFVIILIIAIPIGLIFFFTNNHDAIINSFNNIVSSVEYTENTTDNNSTTNTDKIMESIKGATINSSTLDLLFNEVGDMTEEQYKNNETILLNCGIDNIQDVELVHYDTSTTYYEVAEDQGRWITLQVYFTDSNDIEKVAYYEYPLYENGEYFLNVDDFALTNELDKFYQDVVVEITKKQFNTDDVTINTNNYTYAVYTDPHTNSLDFYCCVEIVMENGDTIIKDVEANFIGENLETITYSDNTQ